MANLKFIFFKEEDGNLLAINHHPKDTEKEYSGWFYALSKEKILKEMFLKRDHGWGGSLETIFMYESKKSLELLLTEGLIQW